MACPTCGHTMQSIGEPDGAGQRYWCPRCGTLRTIGRYGGDDTPTLVYRCRSFMQALNNPATGAVGANLRLLWDSEGVAESINAN